MAKADYYLPIRKLNMAKKLEMDRPTISIDLGHTSILLAMLSRSFTHSLTQSSLIPHRLIHWEAAFILLCHRLTGSEEASLDLSQTPSLSL